MGAILLGQMALPNHPGRLSLDFSSLLGALFFSWIAQLLLPVMLSTLVYEKENRCVRQHLLPMQAFCPCF